MLKNEVHIEVPQSTLETWQSIVDILAEIVGIPAALIMRLSDPDIEVFVASRSKDNPYHVRDKEHYLGSGLYCETVIKSGEKLQVVNALADENWRNNPDIKLNMISYLGFPIFLPNGKAFGTICILDKKENPFSKTVEELMLKFRLIIQADLEIIFLNQVLGDKNKRLTDYLLELQALRGIIPICANCKSIRDDQDNWHPIEHYLVKHPEADFTHGICPTCRKKLYPE